MEHVRKYVQDEIAYRKHLSTPGLSKEDRSSIIHRRVETMHLDRFMTVEMVTAIREPALPHNEDYEVEYFCKWQGRADEKATWEVHRSIEHIAQRQIDAFTERVKAGQRTSN